MNAQADKLFRRRFISKLKRKLRNTYKYGMPEHIKKIKANIVEALFKNCSG